MENADKKYNVLLVTNFAKDTKIIQFLGNINLGNLPVVQLGPK